MRHDKRMSLLRFWSLTVVGPLAVYAGSESSRTKSIEYQEAKLCSDTGNSL